MSRSSVVYRPLAVRASGERALPRPLPRPRVALWATALAALAGGALAEPSLAQEVTREEALVPAATTSSADPFAELATSPFDAPVSFRARQLRALVGKAAALLIGAEDGGDLAIRALATPLATSGESARVPFFIEVDGASLLPTLQSRQARIESYVYALAPDGAVSGYVADVFAIDLRTNGEAVWQSGLRLYGELQLPAGHYRLRFLVRVYDSEAYGLVSQELAVGGADIPLLLPPFVHPPADRDLWIPVRLASLVEGSSHPFRTDGRLLTPSAHPVLIIGRPASTDVVAWNLPPGEIDVSAELASNQAGAEAVQARLDASLHGRRAADEGAELLELLLAPPELPAGEYRMRLVVKIDATELRSAAVPVALVEAAGQERDLVWSDLRWNLPRPEGMTPADQPAVPERSRRRRASRRVAELSGRYRAALGRSLAEHGPAARRALLDFEAEALRGAGENLDLLADAELAAAGHLGASRPLLLAPLLQLHRDLYEDYRQRKLYSLAGHSRRVLEALAELLTSPAQGDASAGPSETTGQTDGPPGRQLAADCFTDLGGIAQRANLPGDSRRLFLLALAHDENHPEALLGLGVSFERYGEVERALAVYQRLVEADPEATEGRLRLALNLDRRSQWPIAARLLRQLEEGDPSWVRSIAVEQLAQKDLVLGQLTTAEERLTAAIDGHPDGSLRILLAHVQDRLGRPRRAFATLAAVDGASDAGVSPRKRYDSWPDSAFDAVRRRLDSLADSERTATVAALAEDSP